MSQVSVYKIQGYFFCTLWSYRSVILLKIVAFYSVSPHMDCKQILQWLAPTLWTLYGLFVRVQRALTLCTSSRASLLPLSLLMAPESISTPLGCQSLTQWHHRTLVSSSGRSLPSGQNAPGQSHQWDNALVLVHLHIQGGARAPAWCCPLLPLMTPSCPAPDCNVGTDLSYHSATSGEFPWLLDPSPRELPLPIVSWHFWNYTLNIINDQA